MPGPSHPAAFARIVPYRPRRSNTARAPRSGEPLKVVVRGPAFPLKGGRARLRIPEGAVSSYRGVAAAIDNPNAARAVGTACGSNSIACLIPCHRVIRADGTLCGYGGGLWRKRWLLEHERKFAQ